MYRRLRRDPIEKFRGPGAKPRMGTAQPLRSEFFVSRSLVVAKRFLPVGLILHGMDGVSPRPHRLDRRRIQSLQEFIGLSLIFGLGRREIDETRRQHAAQTTRRQCVDRVANGADRTIAESIDPRGAGL